MAESATNDAARQHPAAAKPRRQQKPLRKAQPLSAYNLFFRHERSRLIHLSQSGGSIHEPPSYITKAQLRDFLEKNPNPTPLERRKRIHRKTHGAVSFTDLSRIVGNNWKALDAKSKKTFQDVSHEIKVEVYRVQEEERRKARQLHLPNVMSGSLDASLYVKLDQDRRKAMQVELTRCMPPAGRVPAVISSRVEPRPPAPTPRTLVEKEVAGLLLDFSRGGPTSTEQHNFAQGTGGSQGTPFPDSSSSMDQLTGTRALFRA